ncbi:MAG: hypothetical protein KGN16_10630 [Burkholderiales bacterium]|nr:hypothetical protein [Burkholderiales bacterium]
MTIRTRPPASNRHRPGPPALAFGLLLIAGATLAALLLIEHLQHEASARGADDWTRWSAGAALLGGLALLGGSIRLLRPVPAAPAAPAAPEAAPERIGAAYSRRRRFVVADPAFCALLGLPSGALDGRPVDAGLVAADPGAAAVEALRAALAQGLPLTAEWTLPRRDGRSCEIRIASHPAAAGDPSGGRVWTIEDRTLPAPEPRPGVDRGAFERRLAAWQRGASAPATLIWVECGTAAHSADAAAIAAPLHRCLRAGDLVARVGAGAYALLLPGCVAAVGLQLAQRLHPLLAAAGGGADPRLAVVELDPLVDTAAALEAAAAACAGSAGGGVQRLATALPAQRPACTTSRSA